MNLKKRRKLKKRSILKKMVLSIKYMQKEIEDLREYVEGTYCTSVEHNRSTDNIDLRLNTIDDKLEDMI
jgi:hypothetical protein